MDVLWRRQAQLGIDDNNISCDNSNYLGVCVDCFLFPGELINISPVTCPAELGTRQFLFSSRKRQRENMLELQ